MEKFFIFNKEIEAEECPEIVNEIEVVTECDVLLNTDTDTTNTDHSMESDDPNARPATKITQFFRPLISQTTNVDINLSHDIASTSTAAETDLRNVQTSVLPRSQGPFKKRLKASLVWKYFEKKKVGGSTYGICALCKQEYACSGNTSNMRDHLQRKHPFALSQNDRYSPSEDENLVFAEGQRKRKYAIVESFEKSKLYDNTHPQKHCLDRAVTLFVAGGFHPFTIVEEPKFVKLLYEANPRYMVPSKTTLRYKLIYDMYNKMANKLKSILEDISFVSLTCDAWTSKATESYVTVTCHFIIDTNLKSVVLETNQFGGSHTAEHIKDCLQAIILKWNIQKKITCIVTDNAANMISACKLLQVRHLPCYAHTLNLTVNDALNEQEVQGILQKVRNIVAHFKRSPQATEKLLLEQKDKNVTPKKLIQDVPTRWNSEYYMIERILDLWDYVMITLIKLPNAPAALGIREADILREVIRLLRPFEYATKHISGDQYVTSSTIIPLTVGLHTSLTREEASLKNEISFNLCKHLKNSIVDRLFKYEYRTITRIATIIDPRIKKLGFRLPDNAQQACQALQTELQSIINVCNIETTAVDISNYKETDTTECEGLFNFLDSRVSSQKNIVNATSDAIILIRQYLEKPNIARNCDPLEYWKNYGSEPMEKLSHKFFCAPATSVPGERLFSKTGLIISERRTRLKPDIVHQLSFIKQNEWLLD